MTEPIKCTLTATSRADLAFREGTSMKTVDVAVADLSGVQLDYAVAMAEMQRILNTPISGDEAKTAKGMRLIYDIQSIRSSRSPIWIDDGKVEVAWGASSPYWPSKQWQDAGQIIEREEICLEPRAHVIPEDHVTGWTAIIYYNAGESLSMEGDTPLIAAARAYVASKFGETVEIPTVLIKGEPKPDIVLDYRITDIQAVVALASSFLDIK